MLRLLYLYSNSKLFSYSQIVVKILHLLSYEDVLININMPKDNIRLDHNATHPELFDIIRTTIMITHLSGWGS